MEFCFLNPGDDAIGTEGEMAFFGGFAYRNVTMRDVHMEPKQKIVFFPIDLGERNMPVKL